MWSSSSLTPPPEGPPVTLRKVCPRNLQELPRCHVEEDSPGAWHLLFGAYADAGVDLAAQRTKVGGQRIGYLLRATFRKLPTEGVS